jgi:hypothetical protein
MNVFRTRKGGPSCVPAGRRHRGQGLLEFALVLPIFLLILMAIIDYGRAFFVYVNLFNAAREGTRFGLVSPGDRTDINQRVRDRIILVRPDDVNINVWYDRGPDTVVFTDPDLLAAGDRVIVEVLYDLEFMTPLVRAFDQELDIHTVARRTIQRISATFEAPSPAPTFTPDPDATPTPTAPSEPITPTETLPPDVTPSATPTIVPTLRPIVIEEPLTAGDTTVGGWGEPGHLITLRDAQTGLQLQSVVNHDATFEFVVPSPLVNGHTIIVQGYGSQDTAVVGGAPTPTPALTPTPTPTTPYIVIRPESGLVGARVTITVNGYNWPTTGQKKVTISWNGIAQVADIVPSQGRFTVSFMVTPGEAGQYPVTAVNGQGDSYTVYYEARPMPNLRITGLALQNPAPLGTYETTLVTVTLANTGDADVASLFWVDLYADPTWAALESQPSVDWVAINGLAAGTSIEFTMWVPGGFATTGQHTIAALADTWNQIEEGYETDNESDRLYLDVTVESPEPTSTPTPVEAPNPGGVSGTTYVDEDGVQGADVYVYDAGGRLVASTRSGVGGVYEITNLAPGTYVVVGQLRMGESIYRGQNVATVLEGTTTVGVDINLTQLP